MKPAPYPITTVAVRWFLGAVHLAVAVMLGAVFHVALGVLYAILAALTLGVFYPLIRCRYCPYHGVRCNAGWGGIAGWIAPPADRSRLFDAYSLGWLTHLVYLVPFAFIVLDLSRSHPPRVLLGSAVYVVVVALEMLWRRWFGCSRCELRSGCPALHYYRYGGPPAAA